MATIAATASANVYLRHPYAIVCEGDSLEVHDLGCDTAAATSDGRRRASHAFSLARYASAVRANSGRGSNVVHGCDVRDGVLAGGTASGLVLLARLEDGATGAAGASGAAGSSAGVFRELSGHAKVVGFLRLGPAATRLYTSSIDKSVRVWSLPDGACVQTIKAGTPVLQLALLPPSSAAAPAAAGGAAAAEHRVLFGCGDGTLKLWDPCCRKASKALTTLRYAHDDYVGELRVAPDGARALSVSKKGQLQLWKSDAKHGLVPEPAAIPAAERLTSYWRVEILRSGLAGITPRGGLDLWRWGTREPERLAAEWVEASMLDAPSDSMCLEAAAGAAAPGGASVLFAGIAAPAPGAPPALGVFSCHADTTASPTRTARPPPPAAAADAPPGTAGGAWGRWQAVAAEECMAADAELMAELQARLEKMELVAAAAGRELGEASVRACLRKACRAVNAD